MDGNGTYGIKGMAGGVMMYPPIPPTKQVKAEDYGPEGTIIVSSKTEGIKFDTDKVRLDLLPPELIFGVGEILTFGAKKYSERNWELGMAWSRPFGALMRHMWAWWRGEEKDPETGKSHLWHAGCCIAFLIAYEARKVGTDDRPHQA